MNNAKELQDRIDEFNQEIAIGLSAYENGEFSDAFVVMEELRQKFAVKD